MTTATATPATATKPVKVFRDRLLSVSVFRNRIKVRSYDRTFHSVSIQRRYKDGDAYKTAHSFGKDDVPALQLLLGQAWAWMVNDEAAHREKPAA